MWRLWIICFGERRVDHRILKSLYSEGKAGRTAYVERQNLKMRINIRRYALRADAFSKKLYNHAHAVASLFRGLQLLPLPQILGRGITPPPVSLIGFGQWLI